MHFATANQFCYSLQRSLCLPASGRRCAFNVRQQSLKQISAKFIQTIADCLVQIFADTLDFTHFSSIHICCFIFSLDAPVRTHSLIHSLSHSIARNFTYGAAIAYALRVVKCSYRKLTETQYVYACVLCVSCSPSIPYVCFCIDFFSSFSLSLSLSCRCHCY